MKNYSYRIALVSCFCIFLWAGIASANENVMLNLTVPTDMEPKDVFFNVQHRFEGPLSDQPLKNFLGLDEGATVKLGLRYQIIENLEAIASHTFSEQEYEAGLSYAVMIPSLFLKMQLDARYLNYRYARNFVDYLPYSEKTIVDDYYIQLAVATDPILDRIRPVINVGYDGYNSKKIGVGIGLSVKVLENVSIIDALFLQGEFYPNFYGGGWKSENAGSNHSYSFGITFKTSLHNFTILAGNTIDIGTRRLMMGSDTKALHLGFNITRIF